MSLTAIGPSAPPKQPFDSKSAHQATIRKQSISGARKTRNRPAGILPARIARVEFFVECIASLCSCERVERRAGNALRYHAATREKIVRAYDRGEISIETRDRHSLALTAAETQLATQLIGHASRVCTCVIPECKNLASQAERDA